MNRIMIAGTGSGCGKTTITCAVLQAFVNRGMKVSSFKCGPDYIDPMFHRRIIGSSAYNLDSYFCDDDMLKSLLDENGGKSDISVIEGVMGYYDGLNGKGSSHEVASVTDTPAIIVINAGGMSESLGAVMKGFLTFREPSGIAGFIFNRLPASRTEHAKKLCDELGTEYLGRFPADSDFALESRHLGLVTAGEIRGLKDKLQKLAQAAEECILLDRIAEIARRTELSYTRPVIPASVADVRIALSCDEAFCFYYPENISLLEKMGAEIVEFSPLHDRHIPDGVNGIILCGGYPELYAGELSRNVEMTESIRIAVSDGMPCFAECGGFMYLHDETEDDHGIFYPGAGVIRGRAYRTPKLQRFGYTRLTARKDNILCREGGSLTAHEFHYWDSSDCGRDFISRKDGRAGENECIHASDVLWAGFPHIYLYGNIDAAYNFVKACERYKANGQN